jgi:signal peptidase I
MSDSPPLESVRATESPEASSRTSIRGAVEWIIIVVAALTAAILIKTFLIQAFYIPSASMYPTLQDNDRVLVNKLSYHVHDVHRGDIVVFERPPAETQPIKDLIKRVVGLPGEKIDVHDGHVFVNDRQLNEPYLVSGVTSERLSLALPVTLGKSQYWVMGDNRGNSSDSRAFGPISRSLIVGRAFIRVWPIRRCETGRGCHSTLNFL